MDTNKIIENGKIDEKEEEEIDLDKSVMDVEISGYESAQSQDESDVVFPKEEEKDEVGGPGGEGGAGG